MTDAFISYSRKDKEFVYALVHHLERETIAIWLDRDDIPPGEAWQEEIRAGIAQSNVFVFVISLDSVISQPCNLELSYARMLGKRIIPLMHRRFQEDRELKDKSYAPFVYENWGLLKDRQWIEVKSVPAPTQPGGGGGEPVGSQEQPSEIVLEQAHIARLIAAIRSDYVLLQRHTRLVADARYWENNKRASGYLLRGEALQDAQDLLKRLPTTPVLHGDVIENAATALMTTYVEQSHAREQQERRRIFRLRTTAVFALLAIALLAAALAVFNERASAAQERADLAQQEVMQFGGTLTPMLLALTAGQVTLQALESEAVTVEGQLRAVERDIIQQQETAEAARLDQYYNAALAFYYIGDYVTAERRLLDGGQQERNLPYAWWDLLGDSCLQQYKLDCAEDSYQNAIRIEGSTADPYIALAVVYREMGSFAAASRALASAREVITPQNRLRALLATRTEASLAFEQAQDAAIPQTRRAALYRFVLDLLEDDLESFAEVGGFGSLYIEEPLYYIAASRAALGEAEIACDYWLRYLSETFPSPILFESQQRWDEAREQFAACSA